MFAITLLFPASSAATTRVKSSSGYGKQDFNGAADCTSMTSSCEGFTRVGATIIDGLPAVQYQFGFDANGNIGTLTLFDLGPNFSDSAPLTLANMQLGIFACDVDPSTSKISSVAFDSSFPPLPITGLPCSPISSAATGNTIDNQGHAFDFTLDSDGRSITFGNTSGDDVVVYSEAVAATPEPPVLSLMGLGVVVLAGLLLRRRL